MNFTKMHGCGNDFIVVDDFEEHIDERQFALKICNRNFGVGGDGVLLVRNSDVADIKMVIINADGSLAAMCGNGIRCFAKYVWEKGLVKKEIVKIETGDGIKEARLHIEGDIVKFITIYMGVPSFLPEEIPILCKEEVVNQEMFFEKRPYYITSMKLGVPHTVIFTNLQNLNIEEGKIIEKNRIFPQGTNVNFCEILDESRMKVKTWERGAGATLACGTGSSAAVVASYKLGLTDKKVKVEVPGGMLEIEVTEKGVFMTGPAEVSFIGEYI